MHKMFVKKTIQMTLCCAVKWNVHPVACKTMLAAIT